jgi:hypothetical protein
MRCGKASTLRYEPVFRFSIGSFPESRRFHAFIHELERGTQCAGMAAVPRHDDGLSDGLLERGHQGFDACGGALKEHLLADAAPDRHFVQVVLPDAVQRRGKHLFDAVSLAHQVIEVALHENGAAVAGEGGRDAFGPGSVVGDDAAQTGGLLLQETAGAGGADVCSSPTR